MFPSRFFADRYFAPRYFPKVGSGSGVVDTPATFEVGIEYAVPQGQWHYEVPPAIEMSYSPSDAAWHFDSPTR